MMSILSFEMILFCLGMAAVYYALPKRVRWAVPLIFSGAFVILSGWQGAAYLVAVCLLSWLGGKALAALACKGAASWKRKALLALLLLLLLGGMAFLKYLPDALGLVIPVGLSYFSFQSAGFLIDVYRGKTEAPKNPLKVFLFVGYFLQLPQGPISTWKELGGQLTEGHPLEPENIAAGFQRMLWGFFKKLVIADRLAPVTAALLTGEALPGWFVLGGVGLYAMRLYTDFSGGVDIVRGFSQMIGVILPENFRRPFFAVSVADYWRRWHITLGAWFRSYVLYPLTASRAGLALGRAASRLLGKKAGRVFPTALATLFIFLLIGLWHGLSWNAVIYGGYFGLLMGLSMLLDGVWKKLRLPKKGVLNLLRVLRTWLLILPAQYFAFTPDPAVSLTLLGQTFSGWDFSSFAASWTAVMPPLEWIIAGAGLAILFAVDLLSEHVKHFNDRLAGRFLFLRWPIWIFLILAALVFGVYGEGFDSSAFLYTQF